MATRTAQRERTARVAIPSPTLRAQVQASIWSTPGHDPWARLPLLLVHDGPEYARRSALVPLLARLAAAGEAPPLRAALLAPVGDRMQTYGADAAYARALADEVLPALVSLAPTPRGAGGRAGLGCSLGALALLHAHRTHPGTFGGLFLQSGSYFQRRTDPQEARAPSFRRITRFVGSVLEAEAAPRRVPVVVTVGVDEENLANNRALHAALRRQGYRARLHEGPGGHDWPTWRRALEAELGPFLRRLWQ
jgi:enterochelin esterase family protein